MKNERKESCRYSIMSLRLFFINNVNNMQKKIIIINLK